MKSHITLLATIHPHLLMLLGVANLSILYKQNPHACTKKKKIDKSQLTNLWEKGNGRKKKGKTILKTKISLNKQHRREHNISLVNK